MNDNGKNKNELPNNYFLCLYPNADTEVLHHAIKNNIQVTYTKWHCGPSRPLV